MRIIRHIKMRTLEIIEKSVAELNAAPYNPRRISDTAYAALRASVARFGLVQPIVWNRRTGHVVGGHQRLRAASELGEERVKVVVVDLTDSEEKGLNLALNNANAQGQFTDAVHDLLGELKDEDFFAELELGQIAFDAVGAPVRVPDEPDGLEPDPGENGDSGATGEVWDMDGSRLVCGDSRNPDHVRRATQGEPVGALIFDPPFEETDLIASFNIDDYGANDALVFGDSMFRTDSIVDHGEMKWHYEFIWDCVTAWTIMGLPLQRHKNCQWWSRNPQYDHERCLDPRAPEERKRKTKNVRGEAILRADPRGKCLQSIFRHAITQDHPGVPHAKPVLWLMMLIANCTNGNVLDLFAGSGAGLIAAQAIDRRWFGIEIDPGKCRKIVARWESETGKVARCENR